MCTRAVGALAHFFEEEGVPTTGISLVRLHTETVKPPRALWVPFELGHPLGIPDNPEFQKKVILAALKLLEAPGGPLIEDFPEDVPESAGAITMLACPVNFSQDKVDPRETDQLHTAFRGEMAALRPWYDLAVEKRGRTTVGASGIETDCLGDFIYAFLGDSQPENPRDDVPLTYTLKLAADELKAYYYEGITAQPGQEYASSQTLSDWFWQETVAGKVILSIKEKYENSQDRTMRIAGRAFLVPREVARILKK
ncbi:MAG: hypothetical protein V3R96_02605 [Dehalococcoidales bacterium]